MLYSLLIPRRSATVGSFTSASEIEKQEGDESFFTKIFSWFKILFGFSDVQKNPDLIKTEEQKNNVPLISNPIPSGHNIPLMNYTCESIFPDKVKIENNEENLIIIKDTEYENGVSLSITCMQEKKVGGNINRYNCLSGFFVYEDVLPDGTIVNEYNHVEYNFVLDKRNCVEEICSPIEMSCVVENFGPPGLGSSNYLDYYWQPIIKPNAELACEGCVGGDGRCYPIGSFYNGQVCSE